MYLPRDFLESAGRVQVLADGIVRQRFNADVPHALSPEMLECVLDEPSSQPESSLIGVHSQIGNEAHTRLDIDPRGDIAYDSTCSFGDEHAVWVSAGILDRKSVV